MVWLVSDEAVWQYRAQVAREAADELGDLGEALTKVVLRNTFGSGCLEGESLYGLLRMCLEQAAAGLLVEAKDVRGLARSCEAASQQISLADECGCASE